jgi:hypothetical protein
MHQVWALSRQAHWVLAQDSANNQAAQKEHYWHMSAVHNQEGTMLVDSKDS